MLIVNIIIHRRYDSLEECAVAIDDVIEKKLDAILEMESQFIEGGALGHLDPRVLSNTPAEREAIRAEKRERFKRLYAAVADQSRQKLVELYGQEIGNKVKYAEAFEICEYGRQPTNEEIHRLFPFFPKNN